MSLDHENMLENPEATHMLLKVLQPEHENTVTFLLKAASNVDSELEPDSRFFFFKPDTNS